MDQHSIRSVRAGEWRQVKELRIAALKDPAAPVAFLETVEKAESHPDAFWRGRADGASHGRTARQFVAEGPDGTWGGGVTVLVEDAGTVDIFGQGVEQGQGHLVGVFVREEWRGSGMAGALLAAAVEWVWSLEEPVLDRVRLFVHRDNPRAAASYRRFGFTASGRIVRLDSGAEEHEYLLRRPD
ncbi:GNAT family N-acetyltransferase [Streptomyces sp. NPDC057939]|uniref:GNAT family N-acetyltransferase n=1 Tax=Streptomyces sp. NPDC057939 TaxID=3346284 RepID=UPI0036E2DAD9